MKTSVFFKLAMPSAIAMIIASCGGSSDEARINRSTLNQIPRDQFSMLFPTEGATDVCINPQVKIKISNTGIGNNLNICNQSGSVSNMVKMFALGSQEVIQPINVLPRADNGSCTVDALFAGLSAGTGYAVCAFNDSSSSREVLEQCYTFQTDPNEKICPNSGIFKVETIAGKPAQSVTWGRDSDITQGELPFTDDDLRAVSNLFLGSWTSSIFGNYNRNQPIEVVFNQDVDPTSVPYGIHLIKYELNLSSETVENAEVRIDPSNPRKVTISFPNGYSAPDGLYLVWVNRTVKNKLGIKLASAREKTTTTYVGAVSIGYSVWDLFTYFGS